MSKVDEYQLFEQVAQLMKNAVEAEKARQILESEYRTSDVRVVDSRRLEFVAGADR